jgi:hypothetical protein
MLVLISCERRIGRWQKDDANPGNSAEFREMGLVDLKTEKPAMQMVERARDQLERMTTVR